MLKPYLFFYLFFFYTSCMDKSHGDQKAAGIVDQSIEKHGGKNYLRDC